jgi:LysM repeat protein
MITRPEPAPSLLAFGQPEPALVAGTTLNASVNGNGPAVQFGPIGNTVAGPPSLATDRPREVQATARVIESNYVVASGDTLGKIAISFNTTVDRIQALNNLADPRALRIGTKLVIPPPL